MARPSLFIGSSSEGLPIARAMREQLRDDAEVSVWRDRGAGLGDSTLEALVGAAQRFDFAVLILTPDDFVESRQQTAAAPRDNVLFECGLFLGQLGRTRTFMVVDSGRPVKLPSDLAGITLAAFNGTRGDGNMVAAVGEASDPIRDAIKKLGRRRLEAPGFWAPFVRPGAIMVVGRFTQFNRFEPSGVLGVGDAIAMTIVSGFVRQSGGPDVPVMYADRLDGDALRTDLILIGGTDANVLTHEVLSRINTSLRWGDRGRNEVRIRDTVTGLTWTPKTRPDGTLDRDFGVVLLRSNPLSPSHHVVAMFGSFGFGTWAAAKLATSIDFLRSLATTEAIDVECLCEVPIVHGAPQAPVVRVLRSLGSPSILL